ncbi:putative phage tail protein [Paenibacillus dendritiformis]|uniref:putative phage tail protein n=1 Tax=Paenibacillus dendritiformis TaxID=130049 RepID=UPI003664AAEF
MTRSAEMLGRLQLFMRKSEIYKAIFEAESTLYDNRDEAIFDLFMQLSIDTATWALAIYENELGIPVDPRKPYIERRSVIKSKMRGTGKVSAALIKIVADSYTNGDVDVRFDGSIRVKFVSVKGMPPNLEDLKASIEEIKPAHLSIEYEFSYLIWDEIDAYKKSWDEWDALKLTWDQLEVYRA